MGERYDVIVVGGGPAGMMAAISAASQGALTALFEPNERLGKKLNITGKGRCNLTNDCLSEELLHNITCNAKFLYSAFSQLNSQDVMAFFERIGVPLKTERGNRVFPVSDRSFDVSAALERQLKKLQVRILRCRVTGLRQRDGRICGVSWQGGEADGSCVVIATGGLSYPLTGSTGDGYRLAAGAGHTVVEPRGSLVPLCVSGDTCPRLQGLSLRNISLTVYEGEKRIFSELGELLFTHFGVSGPLALSASAHMRHMGEKPYRLSIDLKPALDQQMLDRRLLADFEKHLNSDFINSLNDLLPQKMIPVYVDRSGISPREKVHSLTREQRRELVELLKNFTLPVSGFRPIEEAIITSGGIKVSEVNPSTMESKRLEGLYFAGEVLDVDAYTGGFNLQIAWSTGFVAGQCAAWAAKG